MGSKRADAEGILQEKEDNNGQQPLNIKTAQLVSIKYK